MLVRENRLARSRRRAIAFGLAASLLAMPHARAEGQTDSSSLAPRVLRVGPARALTSVAESSRLARDGDIIEIDAGTYAGDVASFSQNNLTIRAVGGRARIVSTGTSAEGKALWVIKGDHVVVENIEFAGARSQHRNGAGVRHEGGLLTVRGCLFEHNEMGILTWNHATAELIVESSEFRGNAVAPEYQREGSIGHQLYVGAIGRFTLRDSHVHHGAIGHLVKSRARENRLLNNRITDEAGSSSYEIDLPNGGIAYVLGNLIEQSARSENVVIVAFGAEGYKWPRTELYLVNNTFIDNLPGGGDFLRIRPGADQVTVVNNLLVGPKRIARAGPGTFARNFNARATDFRSADTYDYRLNQTARQVGLAVDPGVANGVRLRPEREYVQALRSRPVPAGPYSPGAVQSVAR